MARPKQFDRDEALQSALGIFRQKGFSATSTDDLRLAMGIGRQSFYATFKGKKDVESFWISFEYSQKKSKAHAMPIIAKGYLGYDPAAKKYVTLGVDNMGGSVTESSPGWEADKLTFTGDGQMGGQKISFRETYTKKGDKEMIWSGEMKMGKDWIPVGTDTCKK